MSPYGPVVDRPALVAKIETAKANKAETVKRISAEEGMRKPDRARIQRLHTSLAYANGNLAHLAHRLAEVDS